jgi:hypothetical protein
MSHATATHAHIAYELIGQDDPEVVVIMILSHQIVGPLESYELGEQLGALIHDDLPSNYVIDFDNVWSLGSTAFAEIARFVHRVWRVRFCNIDSTLQLGAALIGLEGSVEFCDSRHAAIRAARRDARRGEEDTVDYPCLAGGL